MSLKNITVSKRPNLISTQPSDNTYKNLSESQLLAKVKLLHEQILKTNQYLMEVHRMSIYNWDDTDTGNIIVSLPPTKKGFLLDDIVRLRGTWDPLTDTPELLQQDLSKSGWIYKVSTEATIEKFDQTWKTGDYALYDEEGNLHNVQSTLLENVFTPILLIESNSIQFDALPQTKDNIQVRAHVKIDHEGENDISVSARGIHSNAYQRAKQLITIQESVPTADNTEGGLRIVYLTELPEVMYDGWLYLIPPSKINIEE
jgi:hypothetical protein